VHIEDAVRSPVGGGCDQFTFCPPLSRGTIPPHQLHTVTHGQRDTNILELDIMESPTPPLKTTILGRLPSY
jgi:hypothetical protein